MESDKFGEESFQYTKSYLLGYPHGGYSKRNVFGPSNDRSNPFKCCAETELRPLSEPRASQLYAKFLIDLKESICAVPKPLNPSKNQLQICNCSIGQTRKTEVPEHWVTVFGFDDNSLISVLNFFKAIGKVVDKRLVCINAMQLRYSSSQVASKALEYNRQIVHNNMIGVYRTPRCERENA